MQQLWVVRLQRVTGGLDGPSLWLAILGVVVDAMVKAQAPSLEADPCQLRKGSNHAATHVGCSTDAGVYSKVVTFHRRAVGIPERGNEAAGV